MKQRSLRSFCSLLTLLAAAPALAQDYGFSVSVDGEHVAGDPVGSVSGNQMTSSILHSDVQIKFESLEIIQVLNALPKSLRHSYVGGETVEIFSICNYPAFVTRSELVVFDMEAPDLVQPIAVIPAALNGTTTWKMPNAGSRKYAYVLRVYGADERFDETRPVTLIRSVNNQTSEAEESIAGPSWEDDAAAARHIDVYGGIVTISGTEIPEGARVSALNETISVDESRGFVVQRILPPGTHKVDVAIADNDNDRQFRQNIAIPADEWFFVGMADLTVGRRWGSGKVVAADPSEFEDIYSRGRLAFYLKGKIRGDYLLTAMADSGEGPPAGVFTGILSKSPQDVLRRIDPNEYYPVYGDQSTTVEDAPTRGKLYVKLERGSSHVMWGDFRTETGDSAFIDGGKAVYGAAGVYNSKAVTAKGGAAVSTSLYAAHPGTISERVVLRGTGGSAYFLRRQGLIVDSETVSIETRNVTTGLVTDRRILVPGVDYRINHLQGVLILSEPLSSGTGGGGLGSRSDPQEIVELVVEYEYILLNPDLNDYSVGGRSQHWLNDDLRVGATGLAEKNTDGEVGMVGADIRFEATDSSYIGAEAMQSRGIGDAEWISADGGLTYVRRSTNGASVNRAYALRLDAQADLSDINSSLTGVIGGTVESRQAGFWSRGRIAEADQLVWNTSATLELNKTTHTEATYDRLSNAADKRREDARIRLIHQLNSAWKATLAGGYLNRYVPGDRTKDNGRRFDLSARATYQASKDLSLYTFGRSTAWHSAGFPRNDRIGIGADRTLGKTWAAGAEISQGTSGKAGLVRLDFHPAARHHSYLGYRINPDTDDNFSSFPDNEGSGVVLGSRHTYSDTLSVHTETNHELDARRRSVISSYGVTYTPDKSWKWDATVEAGRVKDPDAADIDRKAVSVGTDYSGNGIGAILRGEARFEESGDKTRNRNTYLLAASAKYTLRPDWTAQADLDAVLSKSDQGLIADGDYVKSSLGFAYRPIDHERLTLLMRYTALYDLPGAAQVTVNDRKPGPSQRSHVFSIDGDYNLTRRLTFGGKYGYRLGKVSMTRDPDDYLPSSAHLGIGRLSAELTKNLYFTIDYRALHMPQARTTNYGTTTTFFYRINDNVKIGAGYNFGLFSDDLTDLTFNDRGVFLTLVGKY